MNILQRFAHISTFVLDIDGVMTNGNLLVTETGDLLRTMNIRDGYATQLAIQQGYHIWVISGGRQQGPILRLGKLGVTELHIAVPNKAVLLQELWAKHQILPEHTLYMGDDIPDLQAMQLCGLPTCPADAATEVKAAAQYISPINGGQGCVRDVIQKVLQLRGHWPRS